MSEPGPPRGHRGSFLGASVALHAGAGVALALFPARWPAVAAAVVANHAAITLAGLLPRSLLLGPNVRRLPAEAARRIALTFDDGPDPRTTPAVLDLLDASGARASFFCIGRLVERHPDLAREIADRGHHVENHSYRHSHGFALLGPRGLRREVARAQDAIERATARKPTLFRAPAGIRNLWLEPALSSLGLRLVSWTRRGFDTVSRDARRVAARLLAGLAPRDILLLHDAGSARDGRGAPVVLEVLPPLLRALEERGLRSVPVAEALAAAAIPPPPKGPECGEGAATAACPGTR